MKICDSFYYKTSCLKSLWLFSVKWPLHKKRMLKHVSCIFDSYFMTSCFLFLCDGAVGDCVPESRDVELKWFKIPIGEWTHMRCPEKSYRLMITVVMTVMFFPNNQGPVKRQNNLGPGSGMGMYSGSIWNLGSYQRNIRYPKPHHELMRPCCFGTGNFM